jgi:hypothetical protein
LSTEVSKSASPASNQQKTIYNFSKKVCPSCKRTRSAIQFENSELCRVCTLRGSKV